MQVPPGRQEEVDIGPRRLGLRRVRLGGSTAAWKSELAWTTGLATRPADDGERKKLRRLGDSPLIASLALAEGGTVEVAASREHRAGIFGPFADSVGGDASLAGRDAR